MTTTIHNEEISKKDGYEITKKTESWPDSRIEGITHEIVTFGISTEWGKINLTDSQAADIAKTIIMNLDVSDAEDVIYDLRKWQEGE